MTAAVELLPLPEHLRRDYKRMPADSHEAECRHYARACVAHATAAKDAEIEALRAENASLRHHGTLLSNIAYNLAQDDRLPDGMRWSLDDARKRWDAALHPTAAQENER